MENEMQIQNPIVESNAQNTVIVTPKKTKFPIFVLLIVFVLLVFGVVVYKLLANNLDDLPTPYPMPVVEEKIVTPTILPTATPAIQSNNSFDQDLSEVDITLKNLNDTINKVDLGLNEKSVDLTY